jgi:multiple sugar transport system ATP-binding protein
LRVPVPAAGHAAGASLTLGVRPEHLVQSEGAEVRLPITVDQVERLGGHSLVYGRLGNHDLRLVVALTGQVELAAGDRFDVTPDAAHCHLFADDGIALQRIPR